MIKLTTTGARTGRPHTVSIGYLPDEGGRILVIASAAGAPRHPDWYHNLVANPAVTVDDGLFRWAAEATVLTGEERDRLFARAAEYDPGWAAYQEGTARVIPVVALRNVEVGPPTPVKPTSPGGTLRTIHDAFRRDLAAIRADLDRAGPALVAQLKVNCLATCAGLHLHHSFETGGMFPALAARWPELEPVLERLDKEHGIVAALLDQLRAAVDKSDATRVKDEVDRLITDLEAHLAYEEEQLIPILDAL